MGRKQTHLFCDNIAGTDIHDRICKQIQNTKILEQFHKNEFFAALEHNEDPVIIESMLKKWALEYINEVGCGGKTPLNIAIGNGNREVVEILLEYGADPKIRDLFGKTPLETAVFFNNNNVAEMLSA